MSYLEYTVKTVPTGLRKILYFNWALALLLTTIAALGILQLYSVAGGAFLPWAGPQINRFILGFCLMVAVGLTPIWFWRSVSGLAYVSAVGLLLFVEFFGSDRMGAKRWIDLGFMNLQPSEVMKISLVMVLAAYYDWLPLEKTSKILWVILPLMIILLPTVLVLRQPDLGTAILLTAGGTFLMFLAGLHWAYFATMIAAAVALVSTILQSRGTPWQMLKDYQFKRIETFLDPTNDPLGAGYNIIQSKIALGSGGWSGRGFMQGTQSRLNFLPEKQTDFIFTTLAEEFGFIGAISLLALYTLVLVFCILSALQNKDRFSALLILGIASTFFLFFAVNMSMVMGLMPVVGVPLPLVSYGGSAMLILMIGFGLVQSAHVHRPR
ncbi:MAG: rod shape-determining protein RodA [Rhodobacterales bacterium]|jgi:rod shape determining protein RodA